MTVLVEWSPSTECGKGREPTRRCLTSADPAQQPDTRTRTRRFAEIESWIIHKERALRCLTWDVPEGDVRRRLLVAQRDAQRLERLAETSRLAAARRRDSGGRTSTSSCGTGPNEPLDPHVPYQRPSSMATT